MNARRAVLSVIFALISIELLGAAEDAKTRKPNVIVIMTDDQGSADMGCYGASDLQTPAMDALAARGIQFTQFYSAAPVCSPSRAGMLTGRYPINAGLISNASSLPGGEGMPASQITMAEMFKASGYVTAQIGKWHLGYAPETMPNAQGFDLSFGHMGGCIDNFSHFFYWQGPNRHDLFRNGIEIDRAGQYFGDLMVEEASQFISENRAQPFFIYFAMNMPHYPYQGEVSWLGRYKDLPYPRNLYAAFLSSCDTRIGKLIKHVDELKLTDQTIIVFQSDNGHSLEERAHFGGGSAGTFRGSKFSLFEGGIRLPGLISWPGHIPAHEVRDQIVHACDWLPTLAELCQVKLPRDDLDGRSLVPILHSAAAPSPHETLHWYVGGGAKPQWAVRQGEWKLIGNLQSPQDPALTADDHQLFLSNLVIDPTERKNLAGQHPEIAQRLKQLHDRWLDGFIQPAQKNASQDKIGNEK